MTLNLRKRIQSATERAKTSFEQALPKKLSWSEPPRVVTPAKDAGEDIAEEWESMIDLGLVDEARAIREDLLEKGLLQKHYPNWQWKNENLKAIEFATEENFELALKTLLNAQEFAETLRERIVSFGNLIFPCRKLGWHRETDILSEETLKQAQQWYTESPEEANGNRHHAYFNRLSSLVFGMENKELEELYYKKASEVALEIAKEFEAELQDRNEIITQLFLGISNSGFLKFKQTEGWQPIGKLLAMEERR